MARLLGLLGKRYYPPRSKVISAPSVGLFLREQRSSVITLDSPRSPEFHTSAILASGTQQSSKVTKVIRRWVKSGVVQVREGEHSGL